MSQPPTTTPKLEWLFVAFYKDGSVIEQDPDDQPKEQPEGSAFSDVMGHDGELVAFELRHIDGDRRVTVDLITGNFVVNGCAVCAHNQYFEPRQYKLEIVYFRETRVQQDVQATVLADGTVDQKPTGDPRHFVNRYFIGWSAELKDGKKKQVTLAVG